MKLVYKKIKTAVCLLALASMGFSLNGQTTNTHYFMNSSHQKMLKNPALRPQQGYFGIPLLDNVYADVKTNTLNLDHLTFDQGGEILTFMHKDVSADAFLADMADNNFLGGDVTLTLFSGGWYRGDAFWNIDANVRTQFDVNIPYSLFEFAKKGIAMNEPSYYEIEDLRATLNSYLELGTGYSRPFLNNTLIVGAKAKVLLGIGNMDLQANSIKIDAGLDRWVVRSEVSLDASAPGISATYDDEDGRFDGIDISGFTISGFGLGFDLGATYNLSALAGTGTEFLKNMTVSLAVTDIGFMTWSKSNTIAMGSTLDDVVITGDFNIDTDESYSLEDDFDEVVDRLEEITDLKEKEAKSRTTGLRTNINVGLEYEVLPNKLNVGVLSTTRVNPSHTISEFTLGAAYQPLEWLEAGLSYSFVYNKWNTIGLALNLVPKKGVNMFISTDYFLPRVSSEFIPISTKGVNVMFGLSVPLHARR